MEIDLATYAKISADLAEGDVPYRDILTLYGIDDAAWNAATLDWNRKLAETSSEEGDANLAVRFSDLFSAAQDAKKPIAPLDVNGWADLVTDVESIGLPRALGRRQLSHADYFRLVRHWAKAISHDPATSRAYSARRDSAQMK